MPRFPHLADVAGALSDRVFGGKPSGPSAASKVYPLHVGDTYLPPPECARIAALGGADHPRIFNYSPVHGEPALLGAIGDKLRRRSGAHVEPSQLQVMSGATAGLGVVCAALLQPGDEVLLPSPYWPLIRGIIQSRGAVPVEVPIFTRLGEQGFDPVAALQAAITPRTVALYLNSPHNPTGEILDDRLLGRIGELAEREHLWVISDEVYEDLYFGQVPPTPVFAHPALSRRTLATHSLSKGYAMAGARVGYTHGPSSVMAAIRGVQTFVTYCAAQPMQLSAARALREGDDFQRDLRQRYAAAAKVASQALGLSRPPAGTFLFFDTRPHRRPGEDAAAFRARIAEAGVLLTPGAACGADFADWARLCFTAVDPEALSDAMRRLRKALHT